MATLPVDIVNRALDECGIDEIGDLDDGSEFARAASRVYWPTLRQLLSAAHWNFARRQQPLTILGDVSGQLITNQNVPSPWAYMYEWPVDAVNARFVPMASGQTDIISPPIFSTPGTATPAVYGDRPTPFIVASAPVPNDIRSLWSEIEGHDPEQTRVILTNQNPCHLVYTGMMMYPDAWDPLFEQAMVAALACRLAMRVIQDKKFARVVRSDNAQLARQALDAARVRDGNEGWTVRDHMPDWIRARTSYGGWGWGGAGVLCYGWTSVPWLGDSGGVY